MKIRGRWGEGVSVCVVNDSCIVGGVGMIAPACRLDKGTMLQQLPAWPEGNLAIGGNRIVLWHFILSAGQAVVASLERQPMVAASHPIPNAPFFCSGILCSYHYSDPRPTRTTPF